MEKEATQHAKEKGDNNDNGILDEEFRVPKRLLERISKNKK